jgi:hypothetical protein
MSASPEIFRIPPGTMYHMPDVGDRLPWLLSPYAEDAYALAMAWANPYMAPRFGQSLTKLICAELQDWASHVFPLADAERMALLCKTSLVFITVDDAFTRTGLRDDLDGSRRRVEAFVSVLQGERPPASELDLSMLWEEMERMALAAPPAWYRRYVARTIDVMRSTTREAEQRLEAQVLSWDDYIDFRRVNLYGFWVTGLADFAVRTDATGLLAEHAELLELELIAVDHILFHNDFYSFTKEAAIGEQANAVWLLRRDGASLQEAVDHLASLVRSREDEFLLLRDKILAGPLGTSADVRSYLNSLTYLVGGSLRYHQTSGRYHGPHYAGAPVTGGTVTFTGTGNSFVPD